MYTLTNYKTKRALKEAVASGEQVRIYQPGPFRIDTSGYTGTAYLEGPRHPAPHRWYATVDVKDGMVVKVIR